jgi:hypothetical protein
MERLKRVIRASSSKVFQHLKLFFDLFQDSTIFVLYEIFLRLFNMSADRESSTRNLCLCKDKCTMFLVILFIISLFMFFGAGTIYSASNPTSPKLLCADGFTTIVQFVSAVVGISILLLVLIKCCCCRYPSGGSYYYACTYRCPCCSCFTVRCLLAYILVLLPLFVFALLLNFHGMNMIVQNTTDGAVYRCELDPADPDAHPILFSHPNDPSNNTNQICEFWPANSLCESFVSPFYDLELLVKINGVKGAYRCSESSPEGHDVCVSFLKSTQTSSYIQNTFAFVSAILLIVVTIWIERRDLLYKCARRCDCCSSLDPRYQLISRDEAVVC